MSSPQRAGSDRAVNGGDVAVMRQPHDLVPDRPQVERCPLEAPGSRSAPSDALAREVRALAALLVEVVLLAGDRAVFPGPLVAVAESAMGHGSVRWALAAHGDE